jgi:tetratricopeptide (TPR) repeat protein
MKNAIPIGVLVVALGLLIPLQRRIDVTSPRDVIGEESLYFSDGETIRRLSMGLQGIVADIYWIRTVQYFGNKVRMAGGSLSRDTSAIRMDLLAPLLRIITALDPEHIPSYRFGAIFLPERDLPAAIELLEAGIRVNPKEWRLYQDLGYIHWQSGQHDRASQYFEQGGEIEGSAWWMRDLAGIMKIKGGSRDVARQIYTQYVESEDQNIRYHAELRIRQLNMLDELDAINELLAHYKQSTGTCPANLRSLAPRLHARGIPLNSELVPIDPHNFPYVLDTETCTVKQNPESNVPRS